MSFFSQRQVIHNANTRHGITQGPRNVPVAIPTEAGGGICTAQTVTQGVQGA